MARWKVRDEDARALLGDVSNGPFYEMKRKPGAGPRTRPADAHLLPDRHLQGAAHPALRAARRRVGPPAEQQPDLRRPDAAGPHDARWPAGDCRRCGGCSTRAARDDRSASAGFAAPAVRYPPARPVPAPARTATASSSRSPMTTRTSRRSSSWISPPTTGWPPQHQQLAGIGLEELVFGVPHAHVDQRRLLPRASARQPLQRTRIAAPGTPGSNSRPRRPKWPFTSRSSSPKSAASSIPSPSTTSWPTSPPVFHDLRRTHAVSRPASIRTATLPRRASPKHCSRAGRWGWSTRACAARRHLRRLFPAGARGQRPPRPDLPLHLGRLADADISTEPMHRRRG